MLRSLVRRKKNFELIYSGRTSSGLAYRDDVLRLASHNGRLHVSGGPVGSRLDLGALLATQPAGTHVYVCGPQSMINATAAAAEELGWAPECFHSETFIGAQPGGDEVPFDVGLRKGRMWSLSAAGSGGGWAARSSRSLPQRRRARVRADHVHLCLADQRNSVGARCLNLVGPNLSVRAENRRP